MHSLVVRPLAAIAENSLCENAGTVVNCAGPDEIFERKSHDRGRKKERKIREDRSKSRQGNARSPKSHRYS